jgi:Leucine-rich repeat (LRR) protein
MEIYLDDSDVCYGMEDIVEMSKVKYLFCSNKKLRVLPKFPNIFELDCSNNKLKTLPDVSEIKYYDFSHNKIKDYSKDIETIRKGNKYLRLISQLFRS